MHDAQEGGKRRMYLEENMDLVPCTRSMQIFAPETD
jgi:hypothetical protein